MQVLVINDEDGHCHVYDISGEKRTKVYIEMAQVILKDGTEDWSAKMVEEEHGDAIRAAIEAEDVDALLELFEEVGIYFDRSGGGRYYEVDVKDKFTRF